VPAEHSVALLTPAPTHSLNAGLKMPALQVHSVAPARGAEAPAAHGKQSPPWPSESMPERPYVSVGQGAVPKGASTHAFCACEKTPASHMQSTLPSISVEVEFSGQS